MEGVRHVDIVVAAAGLSQHPELRTDLLRGAGARSPGGLFAQIIAIIEGISERTGRIVGWLTLAMVLLGAFNAVARYAGKTIGLNLSSNAYIEGQWYLFSLVFLLGAAHTLQRDQHVRVDVLYGRLSRRSKAKIDLAGTLLFLIPFCLFGLVICFPTVRNSWAVWETSPDPGGLPRYPIKTMLLVCFGLLLIQSVSEIVKRIEIIRGGGE